MAKGIRERSVARLESRPAGGSLTDDPITIGPDKSIRVDLSKLPSPPNVYDADYAWIEHRPGSVSILFGKQSRDNKDELRTQLEIRYPPENLVRHFWGNSRNFHQLVKDFAAKWPVDAERLKVNPATLKSAKEHSEWANFESMALAGTEASIDFYRVPPSGLAQFARGQGSAGLKCVGVVRIQLSAFELLRLLDSAEPIVGEIEAYLPEGMKRQEGES